MPAIHEVATITSKGQITLPKPIRQALGVDYGGKVAFELGDHKSSSPVPMKHPTRIQPLLRFWPCSKKTSARVSTCATCRTGWCRLCRPQRRCL